MVKKPFKGNYLIFEVRASYDENTDSIHLTSKDKDIPTESELTGGEEAESVLRTLLERKGMIPEERFKNISTIIPYPDSPSEHEWDKFPLGVHSNGEEAVWDSSISSNVLIIGGVGSGKSVIQRNILLHCSQNSDKWRVLGIDLHRVEFTSYKKRYPTMIDIATSLTDGLELLRYAHDEMMQRYEELEKLGVNNSRDMNEPPKSLMIILDEANLFLTPEDSNVQVHLEENELKAEALHLLLDISRLGRAAGIHLVLSSQELRQEVLGGELIQNSTTRIAAGALSPSQSQLLLGNNQAAQLNGAIRGRGYLQQHNHGADFQGYFTKWPSE